MRLLQKSDESLIIVMKYFIPLIFIFFLIFSCSQQPQNKEVNVDEYEMIDSGNASWYGKKFHGRITASGEVFDMNKLTAAHRTLPFGTIVRVTNLNNNKSVIVKVNDRGPVYKSRCIDLSKGAANELDMINTGIAPVIVEKFVIKVKKI